MAVPTIVRSLLRGWRTVPVRHHRPTRLDEFIEEYRRRRKPHDIEKAIVIMGGVFYRKRRAKDRTATAFLAAATFG
jgi:hypothetical protein